VPYHVQIESNDPSRRGDVTVAVDKEADWIEQNIAGPRRRGESIFISGRTFTWDEIDRISITQTPLPAREYDRTLFSTYRALGSDVTEQFITGPPGQGRLAQNPDSLSFADDRKVVMVIYGHDKEANTALFDWLRAIGLRPREWSQLVRASGNASPYIGEILDQAFKDAQAVIAFFTPDEHAIGRTASGADTNAWRLQARPNVLFEAGMALVTHPKRTVLAVLGPQELPSDLAGRHYIRLSHTSPEPLYQLATRLSDAGCDTDLGGTDWLNPRRLPDRDKLTQHPPGAA
jgi:predicted nucleotide-binding protein